MLQLVLILGVGFAWGSTVTHEDREVQKLFWANHLGSPLHAQLVDYPANADTEGWVNPEFIPAAKKPAVWYFETPPKIENVYTKSELRCTTISLNGTKRNCHQKFMEGYYWGNSIHPVPNVACLRDICSLGFETFLTIKSYGEWLTSTGSYKIDRNNSNHLPSCLEPLNKETWKIRAKFLYKGPSNLIVWFKPLYWGQSAWFSSSKYSKSKRKTEVRQVSVFHPIGKDGQPFGIFGLGNKSTSAELSFHPGYSIEIF